MRARRPPAEAKHTHSHSLSLSPSLSHACGACASVCARAQGSLLWRISNEQRTVIGILRLLSTVLLAAHYATCLWWYVQREQLDITHPAELLDAPILESTRTWAQVALRRPHRARLRRSAAPLLPAPR